MLGLVAQKNAESESPGTDGLYSRGTAGRILKMLQVPGRQRPHPGAGAAPHRDRSSYTQREPYFVAPGAAS